MKNKLVSIVLPTYNGSKFISESINSIISQTYKNWELIIINDCSTDNTLAICEKFAKMDSRVKVYSNEKNLKLPASLNAGFSKASGEYWTWTSDDNKYKHDALQVMATELDSNSDTGFVFCNQDSIDENGKVLGFSERKRFVGELAGMSICGACFLYRRSVAEKIGGYDKDLFCAEDYDYFCKLALSTNAKHICKSLYQYRKHGMSLSATKLNLVLKHCNKVRAKYCDKLLKKYHLPYLRKQYLFYKLYKYTGEYRFALKAILMNPFNVARICISFLRNKVSRARNSNMSDSF